MTDHVAQARAARIALQKLLIRQGRSPEGAILEAGRLIKAEMPTAKIPSKTS